MASAQARLGVAAWEGNVDAVRSALHDGADKDAPVLTSSRGDWRCRSGSIVCGGGGSGGTTTTTRGGHARLAA